MKRVAITWRFKEETADYYKERHLNPWPELVEVFRNNGWHNFSIWAAGNVAFLYAEVEDDSFAEAMARVDATEVKQRWQADMNPMLEDEAIPGTGVQFMEMEEIWYLE